MPFQQLWQATDAAGVLAAQPGIEAFFAGYSGIREQRTLVQNQAYMLDQVKGQGLLSVQEWATAPAAGDRTATPAQWRYGSGAAQWSPGPE